MVKLNLIDPPKPTVEVAPTVPIPTVQPSVPVPKVPKAEKKPVVKEIKKEQSKEIKTQKVEVQKPEKQVPPKVIEKKPIEKKVIETQKLETKKIEKPIEEPNAIIEKSESLTKFEEEMVYIPDAALVPSVETSNEADDLGSFLSTPSTSTTNFYPSNKVQQLYGAEYLQFSDAQKKFIEDHLDEIQQITQRTLTQRGYPRGAGETGQEGTNIVSFNLHPNGDISNLRLKSGTGYRALDENSVTLIKVAYKDYPYPSTTTKIVFHVHYSIYGY